MKTNDFADLAQVRETITPKVDVKHPQNITFYYRFEKGKYNVYLGGQTKEILSGVFDTEEEAKKACIACNAVKDKPTQKVAVTPRHVKVGTPVKLQIQAVALQLDPVRRVRFRESMICINYLIHILVDAIDENSGIFDAMFDNTTKQRINTINKQLDKMLDAIYQSQVMGINEDYTAIASSAYALRERFEMFVSYIAGEKWRFDAMDKCFNDLLPDDYINAKRAEIAEKMKMDIIGDTRIKDRPKDD